MTQYERIGFIGAGKMATGLGASLPARGFRKPETLLAFDPMPEAARAWREATGGAVLGSAAEVAASADVLVLAVKPQVLPGVLETLAPAVTGEHLVVSIAAGVRTDQVEAGLPAGARVVRVMPNVLCVVGEAASAFCLGRAAVDADSAFALELLNAVGRARLVPEGLMDAVTGLSGSGPAYAAVMIDALADGGVAAGLPRDVAQTLAAQTLLGTAKMILEQQVHPAVLKEMVTSPGGTTIAGLHAMEDRKVRAALMDAVVAAAGRSRELSGD